MSFRFISHGGGRRRVAVLSLAGSLAVAILLLIIVPKGIGAEQASASAAAPKVILPVVARPPADQPAVGLPDDRHLDKTPPHLAAHCNRITFLNVAPQDESGDLVAETEETFLDRLTF